MGDTTYKNWKARLAGATVMTHDGDPDVGFYRKPIRADRKDGNHIIGWTPVAYFMDGGAMVGVIGDRDMTGNEFTDLWTYVCAYPIPEEVYRDIEAGKEWPDGLIGEPKRSRAAVAKAKEAANNAVAEEALPPAADGRQITKTDNQPPEEVPLIDQIRERVANFKTLAEGFKTIDSDEKSTEAAGTRNLINEVKNQAEKHKEVLFRPHKDAADKVAAEWNPVIQQLEKMGKDIFTAMRKHEQDKREKAAEAARLLAEENAKIEERNDAAIDRAFSTGAGPDAPVVLEAPKELPPELAPRSTVKATHGRAAVFQERTFVEIVNIDEVFKHYRANAEVVELLTTLAKRDVTAGLTVPGTTNRKGVA